MRLTLLLCSIAACHAATITGFGPVTGSGTGSLVSVTTPFINNDNVIGPSQNEFVFQLTVTGFGSIHHPITGIDTGGTTEYQVTAGITNGTSLPIVGWLFNLPGSPYDFDYLNFDSPDLSNLGWTVNNHTDSALLFMGGPSLSPGASMIFSIAIDVPFCNSANCDFSSTPIFASGTAPEPGTAALLAPALLGLLVFRKRRI